MSTDKARRGRPKGSGLDDRVHLDAMRGLITRDPSLKPTTAIKMLGITDPSAIRRLRDKFKSVGGGDEPGTREISAPHRESLDTVTALPQSIVAAQKAEDLPGSVTALLERAPAELPAAEVMAPVRALKIIPNVLAPAAPDTPPLSAPPRASEASADQKPKILPDPPLREPAQAAHREASGAKAASGAPIGSPRNSSHAFHPSHGDEAMTLLVRWYASGVTAFLSTTEAQMKVMQSVLKAPPVQVAVKQQLMFCEFAKAFLAGGSKGRKP